MTEPQDPFATQPPAAPQPYGAPPPAPYGAPLYGEPLPHSMPGQRRNGLGTAAFVLALVSLCLFWTLVAPLLALVLGITGQRRVSRGQATNGGLAVTAIVLGALTLLGGIAVDGFLVTHHQAVSTYIDCVDKAGSDRSAVKVCEDNFRHDLGG